MRKPAAFAGELLRSDLWKTQVDIMNAVIRHKRTAVKACHASSKTWTAARLALWWALSKPNGIAITTASSWVQVERLLWAEIHDALGGSRVGFPQANKTELTFGPKNFILGLSTNLGDRFRGFPRDNLLIILDEATGIRGEIWEELPGLMAGGNVHVLALGNPVVPGGPFHDAFTLERDLWKTFTINAFDTPNFEKLTRRRGTLKQYIARLKTMDEDKRADLIERQYLINPEWVLERAETWGIDNPRFQSRVLGQFPDAAENALIELRWLEDARYRETTIDKRRPVNVGIDVAGPGESETVVYIVQGPNVVAFEAWGQRDTRGAVLLFLKPWAEKRLVRNINVDSIGIGEGMFLHLRDHFGAEIAREVKVGKPARDSETFLNLRAELCWAMRERFETGEIAGLTDERTIAQASTILYEPTPTSKIKIEEKEIARNRGVKSPDRFEALMLAFAGRIRMKKKLIKSARWGRRRSSRKAA